MAQPSTRSELITYAKRQLGAPVLEINVADEQVEDILDDAIQFFQERHFDGVYPTFLKYKITEDDIKRGRSRDGNTDNVGLTTTTATSTIDGGTTTKTLDEGRYVYDVIVSSGNTFYRLVDGNILVQPGISSISAL